MGKAGSPLSVFSGPWPPSAKLLLAANAVPVLLVYFAGWSLGELLALYWLESAIIGLFNILKMLSAGSILGKTDVPFDPPAAVSLLGRLFICVFFTVHFGGFMAGHGVFLVMIMKHFRLIGPDADILSFLLSLKWAAAALLVSHGYSFFANYLPRERARATVKTLMGQPYPRIFVMHLTIILGMFFLLSVGASLPILVIFTALKTAVDLGSHLRERSKFAPAAK